jgi:hypothetical protein
MVVTDLKTRPEILDYFKSLFEGGLARDPDEHTWTGLVGAVLDLNGTELCEDIARAFEDDLVDTDEIAREDVLAEFERGLTAMVQHSLRKKYRAMTHIKDELTWMAWKVDPRRGRPKPKNRGIDKHAPCPCGSGIMFKKCCGKAV